MGSQVDVPVAVDMAHPQCHAEKSAMAAPQPQDWAMSKMAVPVYRLCPFLHHIPLHGRLAIRGIAHQGAAVCQDKPHSVGSDR